MAQQIINIGTTANDGTGDQLRDAFDKVNDNDTELYAASAAVNAGTATVVRTTAPITLAGAAGDTIGMIALDATPGVESVYVCFETYVAGPQDIWIQLTPADIVTNAADIVTNGNAIGTNATNISTNLASINSINAGTGTVVNATVPGTSKGLTGDLAGQIAYATGFIYICTEDWTVGSGTNDIWQQIPVTETAQPW